MAWWEWCQEKYNNTKKIITDTTNQIKNTAEYVWSYRTYVMPYFNFTQFWEGWSRVMNPNIVPAFLNSPKTRGVTYRTFAANILYYAAAAFVYEASVKPQVQETSFETPVKLLAAWYFWRLAARLFLVENPIYNANMAKAAAEENPHKELFPGCACSRSKLGQVDVIKGNLAGGFYYYSHVKAAELMGTIIPYANIPYLAEAYGQTLMEVNLGEMCTKHRYEVLSKNNWYAFGFGLSMIAVIRIISLLTWSLIELIKARLFVNPSETNMRHIDFAITAIVFQYYILLSQLIDKPYPGKEPGPDIFYFARSTMESLMQYAGGKISEMLKKPGEDVDFQKIVDSMNNSWLVWAAKWFTLYPAYHSREGFAHTKEVQQFFDLHGDGIQNFLAWLIKTRKKSKAKRFAFISKYIPNFIISQQALGVIRSLVEEKMDGVFETINDFITTARIKVTINDAAALRRAAGEPSYFAQAYQRFNDFFYPPALLASPPLPALPAPPDLTKPLFIPLSMQDPNLKSNAEVIPSHCDPIDLPMNPGSQAKLEAKIDDEKSKELNKWMLVEPKPDVTLVSMFNLYTSKRKTKKSRVVDLETENLDEWQDMQSKKTLRVTN